MDRILVVRSRLWVRGKGLSLEPGFVPDSGHRIQAGSRVMVSRPDGSTLETRIRGISTDSDGVSPVKMHLWLDVDDKNQVPIGSEVWSIGI